MMHRQMYIQARQNLTSLVLHFKLNISENVPCVCFAKKFGKEIFAFFICRPDHKNWQYQVCTCITVTVLQKYHFR